MYNIDFPELFTNKLKPVAIVWRTYPSTNGVKVLSTSVNTTRNLPVIHQQEEC